MYEQERKKRMKKKEASVFRSERKCTDITQVGRCDEKGRDKAAAAEGASLARVYLSEVPQVLFPTERGR